MEGKQAAIKFKLSAYLQKRRLGLSQREMANNAGVSRSFLSLLENDKQVPKTKNNLKQWEKLLRSHSDLRDCTTPNWAGDTDMTVTPSEIVGNSNTGLVPPDVLAKPAEAVESTFSTASSLAEEVFNGRVGSIHFERTQAKHWVMEIQVQARMTEKTHKWESSAISPERALDAMVRELTSLKKENDERLQRALGKAFSECVVYCVDGMYYVSFEGKKDNSYSTEDAESVLFYAGKSALRITLAKSFQCHQAVESLVDSMLNAGAIVADLRESTL